VISGVLGERFVTANFIMKCREGGPQSGQRNVIIRLEPFDYGARLCRFLQDHTPTEAAALFWGEFNGRGGRSRSGIADGTLDLEMVHHCTSVDVRVVDTHELSAEKMRHQMKAESFEHRDGVS
jgi:hypothetical protein